MDKASRARFDSIKGLDRVKSEVRCKVCGSNTREFGCVDFNKVCNLHDAQMFGWAGVPVYYYKCINCGFVFTTQFDDWEVEDFSRYIYNDDYVLVDGDYVQKRPTELAHLFSRLAGAAKGMRILDYGSGAGVFVSQLRQLGFAHVEAYDPFSSPARPDGEFDIITCFEVIEHSPQPFETVRDMRSFMKPTGIIIGTTGLQPPNIDAINVGWWYIGPRNGHVSIFTPKALAAIGSKFDLQLHLQSSNGNLFAFIGRAAEDITAEIAWGVGFAVSDEQVLYAPRSGGGTAWHGLEISGDMPFRWSKSRALRWEFTSLSSGSVTFRIPIFMEIRPGFSSACRCFVDGECVHVRNDGLNLLFDYKLGDGQKIVVELHTEDLIKPSDMTGAKDDRPLGVAVLSL